MRFKLFLLRSILFITFFLLTSIGIYAQKEGGRLSFGFNGGGIKYWGEFQDKQFWLSGDVFLNYDILPFLSLQTSAGLGQIRWKLTDEVIQKYPDYFQVDKFANNKPIIDQDNYYGTGTKIEAKNSVRVNTFDACLAFNFFSSQRFIPFVFGGIGYMQWEPRNLYQNSPLPNNNSGVYKKNKIVYPVGVGYEVYLTDNLVFNGKGTYRFINTSFLDDYNSEDGKSDGFVTFGIGLSYYILGDIDWDKDGLTNSEEKEFGTDPRNPDSDGDGIKDGEEAHRYKTNPKKADTDGDGLKDGEEVYKWKTDPLLPDTDNDGLQDGDEVARVTNPLVTDTDGDGLLDGDEVKIFKTDPTRADTDNDELNDGDEVRKYKTDPLAIDTDSDGLLDGEEVRSYKTNPLLADSDSDGISDKNEITKYKTDPLNPDTDNDKITDGDEVNKYKTDPLNVDSDKDGIQDGDEINKYKSDPLKADSDNDGLSDGDEINKYGTDPLKKDTDGDDLKDGDEVLKYKTDPLKVDTDGDGLKDGEEVNKYKTDPNSTDTDKDKLDDGDEIKKGTNPNNPDSDADKVIDGEDACPLIAGVPSTDKTKNGCPAPPPIGTKKDFPDINFIVNTDKFDFENPLTIQSLSKLLSYVNQCDKIKVNIEGHASAEGNAKRNQQLSELRALKVQGWLVQNGVKADRIMKVVGYGSSRPKIAEPTGKAAKKMKKDELETIRKQNRRITVEIVQGCD
jgi:outer membrane protein OmpA-like peptidoglycan-associated protein